MTIVPFHHPDGAVLIDHASGALPESVAVVVATHLALCPICRGRARVLDAIGGALLEAVEPDAVTPGCRDAVLARLDDGPLAAAGRPSAPDGDARMPHPLRRLIGDPGRLEWQRVTRGAEVAELMVSRGRRAGVADVRTLLVRLDGNLSYPGHVHRGLEMNLVLEGGYEDASGRYARGDLAVNAAGTEHAPRAAAEGCLCLSAVAAPLDGATGAVAVLPHTFRGR